LSDLINRQYYLASRPKNLPTPEEVPARDVPVRSPAEGEVVVKNKYISLDPAIRGWMGEDPNYIDPIKLGDAVMSSIVGTVVESNSPDLAEGDTVLGLGAWESYTTAPAAAMNKLDPNAGIPLTNYLSALGPTGLTAYFGLLEVGLPKAGETVLVSAAAGAVGSVVGQIAKIKGCRVVGMAGTDEKCQWLTDELGFDEAINYKTCGDYLAAIQNACPAGVDVYFDNVGGEILEAALLSLNKFARVAVCGWISSYNDKDTEKNGPANLWQLVAKSVRIQGFVVIDYAERFPEGIGQLAEWVMAGKIKFKEDVVDGLDNILPAFHKLFNGTNDGKLMIHLPD
jgi:NADPH-dependent curcumin reductase CurA